MQKFAIFKSVKFNRRHKALLLVGFIISANVLAFYSAVLAEGTPKAPLTGMTQPAGPTPPAKAVVTPKNEPIEPPAENPDTAPPSISPPQNSVNSIPEAGESGSIETQGQEQAQTLAAKANLITQYAEQVPNTPITPVWGQKDDVDDLVSTYKTDQRTPGQPTVRPRTTLIAMQSAMSAITANLAMIANTNPQTGSTTGWSAPFFEALQAMFYYTIGGGWVPKLGWIIGKFIGDFVGKWLGPAIGQFCLAKLIAFKDNPDVSYQTDNFSIQMRAWFHMVRNMSYSMLLVLFIFSIWRYWNNAVWGNGRLLSAIVRLIFATGVLVAWPEIYHYTIMLGNSVNELFVGQLAQDPDQIGQAVVTWFTQAVQFKATNADLAAGTNVIPFGWVIELVINLAIAIAMFVSMLAFFVEKAIQLTIIVMAYIFAPFFLVGLASPDTSKHAEDFIRTFVDATIWNFIWSGLIALLVYTINQGTTANSPIYQLSASISSSVTNNPDNPWFVLLLVLGIMQAMLQVPHYVQSGHFGAKAGILELGFASWMGNRAISAIWGTNGVYTQYRHALWDSQSHRWPVKLPQVPNLSGQKGNLEAGQQFAKDHLDVSAAGSTGTGALLGTAGAPLVAGAPLAGVPGVPLVGGLGMGLGSSDPLVPAQQGGPAPLRGITNIDKMTGEQSQTSRVADMVQRTRLFGDFYVAHKDPKAKKTAGFVFEQKGGIDDIIMPKNATKEQKALTWAAASFANVVDERGNIDPGFEDCLWYDKIQRSMKQGGPFNPFNNYGMYGQVQPTLLDRIAMGIDGGRFSQAYKDVLSYRLGSRWNNKMIAAGVSDYMNGGKQGTAIASYWTHRRGPFDAASQVYRLTEPMARAGGGNAERLETISALVRANVESTKTTRTAAAHPAVLRVRTTDRPEYIQSMVRLLQESAAGHFGDELGQSGERVVAMMSEPEGHGRLGQDTVVNFYDGVMNRLEDDHVHAATAITRNHGIKYVTPGNVAEVVRRKRDFFTTSMDRKHFDYAAKTANLNADYHPFVGNLRW